MLQTRLKYNEEDAENPYHLLEGYIKFREPLHELGCVLVVHVVVGVAVHEVQVLASQLLRQQRHVAGLVARQVVFRGRQAHVPLSVHCI